MAYNTLFVMQAQRSSNENPSQSAGMARWLAWVSLAKHHVEVLESDSKLSIWITEELSCVAIADALW